MDNSKKRRILENIFWFGLVFLAIIFWQKNDWSNLYLIWSVLNFILSLTELVLFPVVRDSLPQQLINDLGSCFAMQFVPLLGTFLPMDTGRHLQEFYIILSIMLINMVIITVGDLVQDRKMTKEMSK
ncbi:hypothetical protein PT285_03065 [Lactobacillus sp. ESL0791]|uniref:hypothetical protein n=1 Tax=Lactobacillus sp. ESL0791 TaxID=2983234 RepID=UPI0023F65F41|nr:hypothetical protein [Lactobacillus sp. ESL0791]MDF7638415.1 hypothetical protein [Lactobacillus sp. ESL0791]